MAFPTGWGRKQKITIPAAQVGSGGVSNFTVTVTRDMLDDEVVDPSGGNKSQSNGGDVRFSSDAAGTTQLACDVIAWEHDTTTAAGDAFIQVSVKLASLSSSSANDFYIWYNTAGTDTQPAVGDTYGQHNAYDSSWEGYWPLQSDLNDRTGNNNDATATGDVTAGNISAKLGNGSDFDGTGDTIDVGQMGTFWASGWTVICWANTDSDHNGICVSGDDASAGLGVGRIWQLKKKSGGTFQFLYDLSDFAVSVDTTAGVSNGAWHQIGGTNAGGVGDTGTIWLDGDSNATGGTNSDDITGMDPVVVFGGQEEGASTNPLSGSLDEVEIHSAVRNAAWFKTRYNNINAPASFGTAGTPETPGGGGGSVLKGGLSLMGVGR